MALLLAGGRAGCAFEALADALWDGNVPPSGFKVIHAQVSRLRRILEPDRPARTTSMVLASETGYHLDLSGHTLDADAFGRLVDQGRAALEAGSPTAAKANLEEALALWRGRAYGDLADRPAIQSSAAALDERRLVAREDLIDARLELGEHAELVGELEKLVGEHTFREGFWRQLMLALYRCGRQAEALATYQRRRRRLVAELGIEPSPASQDLNEAILLQRPDLQWRPVGQPAAPTSTTPRPRRPMPTPQPSFVGRDGELADTIDALEAHRLVTVTGTGGVGKTRLAIEITDQIEPHFRHGVGFCDLVSVPGADRVPASVAAALGVDESIDAGEDSLVAHLANRELLLVVDNADHTVDAVAELADQLLASCPRLRILVTSREPLHASGERLMPLAPLGTTSTDDAATRLFIDRALLSAPHLTLDPDRVLELCRRLDGLPLAIELAASRVRSIPLDDLIEGLDDHLSEIAPPHPPRDGTIRGSLREVLDWSIEQLDERQRTLLRRLAVFAGGCQADAAAIVCGIEDRQVDILAELVDRSLLELDVSEDGTRYRLLETIRADGLGRLAEHDELDDIRLRHLAWCRCLVPEDPGHGEDPSTVAALAPEIDNCVATLAVALDGLDVAGGARLAVAAAPYWVHAGRFDDARSWLERAVAATPPATTEHRLALRWLGWTLARQGHYSVARARLEQLVALAGDADDSRAAGDASLLLGSVEIEAGDLSDGQTRIQSLPDSPNLAIDPQWRARHCHALGVSTVNAGDLDKGVDLLEAAASAAREARMWHTLVRALTSLAQSESRRRHYRRAEGALAEGLEITRQQGLLGLMPRLLGVRAVLSGLREDWTVARALFEESLAAARLVGDRRVEMISLTNLGVLDLRIDQPVTAIERYEEALELARQTGDERSALLTTTDLAEAIVAAYHDTDRALALAVDTINRGRRAGIRLITIAAVEAAAVALADRDKQDDMATAAIYLGATAAERETLELYEDPAGGNAPIERMRARIDEALGAGPVADLRRRGADLGIDAVADFVTRPTSH